MAQVLLFQADKFAPRTHVIQTAENWAISKYKEIWKRSVKKYEKG